MQRSASRHFMHPVTQHARLHGWHRHKRKQGQALAYHFTSLPRRAFETLLDRAIRPMVPDAETVPDLLPPPSEARAADATANTTPPWVLPLMRIIRDTGPTPLSEALAALPLELPRGSPCPSAEEATAVLASLGYLS